MRIREKNCRQHFKYNLSNPTASVSKHSSDSRIVSASTCVARKERKKERRKMNKIEIF